MKLKLIHKLLLALFACTVLVLVAVTWYTRENIGRGFVDFLQLQDRNRVAQLAPVLSEWYRESGDWALLAEDPSMLKDLAVEWFPGEPRPGAGRRGGAGPGGPGPGAGRGRLNSLPHRLSVLDAERRPVFGLPLSDGPADSLIAIKLDGRVVGWLGVSSPRGVNQPEEQAFVDQLRRSLLAGLGIGLLMAAALAWLLARHLSRPIAAVAEGIRDLAQGHYDTQVEIGDGDEIARLGGHVNRLAASLKESESVRKRWMSEISHDLRTPLSIISGELEAMLDGVRPLDEEQLRSVQAEVRHISHIISDLHNLALTDLGALTYRMQPLDLGDLAAAEAANFRTRANTAGLELSFEGSREPLLADADEQRIGQLLRNLLENSLRYTDAPGLITVRLERTPGFARLSVSDTPPAATDEECKQLFEHLYRVEGSRNRNAGGSGLGLAICRNIATAHGGSIRAEPGPDGGLLVTVDLPLSS